MPFRVFADANVLVRARWRDVVLSLADAGSCEILWSDTVLEEMKRHLPAAMSDNDRSQLVTTMNTVFPDANVRWPGAVEVVVRLGVNDKDRHVVAAALWGHADVLLTDDRALGQEVEAAGLIECWSMPEFVAYTMDVNEETGRRALITMARERWLRDPSAADDAIAERLASYFARNGWATESLTLD